MILPPPPGDRQRHSILGRASPLTKLGVAAIWLVGLVLTLDPRVPLLLTAAALAAALVFGNVPAARLGRALLPLWSAALAVFVFVAIFGAANADPQSPVVLQLGPLRVTAAAVSAALAIALRIVAIAAISVAFAQTTDATGLADALAVQARLPERFAYGALAAYQAVPGLADDLLTLRQARRIRGLRGGWHPGLLVALLVQAVRRAEALALAMDARGFGDGPRTWYREVHRGWPDLVVGSGGLALVAGVLLATG